MKEGFMNLLPHRQLPPTARDSAIARDSGQRLSHYARPNRPLSFHVEAEREQPPIQLPAGAVALLMDILEAMAAGRRVTIIPPHPQLTPLPPAHPPHSSRP